MKVEDGQEITHEMATAALRRAVHFFSALQSTDGHWPAENAGPLFFLPPLVTLFLLLQESRFLFLFFFFLFSIEKVGIFTGYVRIYYGAS